MRTIENSIIIYKKKMDNSGLYVVKIQILRRKKIKLKSKQYSKITYKKGKNIFLVPDEFDLPFYFDVVEDLTENDEAMTVVASALDEVTTLVELAKDFLKKALLDERNEYYVMVAYFMEFHRDEIDTDTVAELFPIGKPSILSFIDMVDYLKIKRFGSLIDSEYEKQIFIMDLSFNPEITDELMVIYFNLEKQIITITHES